MKFKPRKLDAEVYSVRAIDRAVQLLCCFSFEHQRLTLGDLAVLTGLPKTTLFRVLQTLESHKLLFYSPDTSRYSLGARILELGKVAFSSLSLSVVASPFLDDLVSECGQRVMMAVLSDGEVVVVDERMWSEHFAIVKSDLGRRRPPHSGASGALLMAYLREEEVDELLRRYPLSEKASNGAPIDETTFKHRLREIRRQGYSYDEEGVYKGIAAIGAPVRDYLGNVIASVGMILPVDEAGEENRKKLIRLSLQTAGRISEAMGWSEARQQGSDREAPLAPRDGSRR